MSEERIVIPVEPEAAKLRQQFEEDYKEALRGRNSTAVSTIRMLRAAVQSSVVARTDQKRQDFGRPLGLADLIAVIEKQIKQREESAEAFDKANRAEKAAIERAEAEYLRRYLPQKLERAEIVAVVQRLVAEHGADFRKVMPAAAKELKGKADGRTVQEIVREMTG